LTRGSVHTINHHNAPRPSAAILDT